MNSRRKSLVASAIAVGAGATAASSAQAELIVNNIDETVTDGKAFEINLDGIGGNDFRIQVGGGKAGIRPLGSGQIFAAKGSVVRVFEAGQTISGGSLSNGQLTFYSGSNGPFGTIGATGFIGLVLDPPGGGGGGAVPGGAGSAPPPKHFGWLEITRGSITVGQSGFQTTPGVGVQAGASPEVPEPSSLAMLAGGAIGLAVLRRRKKRSVQA